MYGMPQVTVYVRENDLSKWKAIEKKAEWIHNHLNDGWKQDAKLADKILKGDLLRQRVSATAPAVCKIHKLPLDDRGRCLQKGCKYA